MKAGSRLPWLVMVVLCSAAATILLAWAIETLHVEPPLCPLKAYLGIPCATCGGTRCALALMKGHLGEAFHWHPVLALAGCLSPLAMFWDLRRAWRRDPYPSLPEGRLARIGVVLLLVGTWMLQVARGI